VCAINGLDPECSCFISRYQQPATVKTRISPGITLETKFLGNSIQGNQNASLIFSTSDELCRLAQTMHYKDCSVLAAFSSYIPQMLMLYGGQKNHHNNLCPIGYAKVQKGSQDLPLCYAADDVYTLV
jgi:hypothetical protein